MVYTKVLGECPKGFIKPHIKPNECYGNVFKFAERNRKLFKEENMKIAYGFLNDPNLADNLWFRHCFILDKNNNVLDITLLNKSNVTNNRYIVFKTFNSSDDLLKNEEFIKDTSLSKSLLPYEKHILSKYVDDNMVDMIKKSRHSQDIMVLKTF